MRRHSEAARRRRADQLGSSWSERKELVRLIRVDVFDPHVRAMGYGPVTDTLVVQLHDEGMRI